jgi:hypothetical protein
MKKDRRDQIFCGYCLKETRHNLIQINKQNRAWEVLNAWELKETKNCPIPIKTNTDKMTSDEIKKLVVKIVECSKCGTQVCAEMPRKRKKVFNLEG